MRVTLILVLLALAVTAYATLPSWFQPALAIDPTQARRQRFGIILDLRSPAEREEDGFYPNAIPVEFERIATEVPYLLGVSPSAPPPPTAILVYSQPGDGRAARAAQELYSLGYRGVRYLETSFKEMLPPM